MLDGLSLIPSALPHFKPFKLISHSQMDQNSEQQELEQMRAEMKELLGQEYADKIEQMNCWQLETCYEAALDVLVG